MPDRLVVYRFGPFEFNLENRTLSRADTTVTLSAPQVVILAICSRARVRSSCCSRLVFVVALVDLK
jgi:hypothetical protein